MCSAKKQLCNRFISTISLYKTFSKKATAAGFAALRNQAPERSAELASAMQRVFYRDGKSLSDPDAYRGIAARFGLDPEAVATFMNAPETAAFVRNEFLRVSRLGVQGYPTLLLRKSDSLYQLGGGSTTLDALEERLTSVLG